QVAVVYQRIVAVVAANETAAPRDSDAAANGQRHRRVAVVALPVQSVVRVAAKRHPAAASQGLWAAALEVQLSVGAAASRSQVGHSVERQAARHAGLVLVAVDVLRGVQGRSRRDRYPG